MRGRALQTAIAPVAILFMTACGGREGASSPDSTPSVLDDAANERCHRSACVFGDAADGCYLFDALIFSRFPPIAPLPLA